MKKERSPIKKSPKKIVKKVSKPKPPKEPKVPKPKATKTSKTKKSEETSDEIIDDLNDDNDFEGKTKNSDSDEANGSFTLQLEDSDDENRTTNRPSRLKKTTKKTLDSSSDEDTIKPKKTVSKNKLEDSFDKEESLNSSSSESEASEPIKPTKKAPRKRREPKNDALSVDNFINNDDILSAKKPAKPKNQKAVKPRANTKKAKQAEPAPNDSDDEELLKFIEKAGDLEEPKPLFDLDPDGSLPELPQFVYRILEKDFGHKTFRPHQAESILRIACGLSTVVVLSTGTVING